MENKELKDLLDRFWAEVARLEELEREIKKLLTREGAHDETGVGERHPDRPHPGRAVCARGDVSVVVECSESKFPSQEGA